MRAHVPLRALVGRVMGLKRNIDRAGNDCAKNSIIYATKEPQPCSD